jgi:hypothetical protein
MAMKLTLLADPSDQEDGDGFGPGVGVEVEEAQPLAIQQRPFVEGLRRM